MAVPNPYITVTVDKADQMKLLRAMERMQKVTGRSLRAVVWATSKEFNYQALRAGVTPVADTHQNEAGPDGKVWAWIRVKTKNGEQIRRLPVSRESAAEHGQVKRRGKWVNATYTGARRRIEQRGFLKSGWSGCLIRMGARPTRGRGKGELINPLRWSAMSKNMSAYRPYVVFSNTVPFAKKYETVMIPQALRYTVEWMHRHIEKVLLPRQRAAWKS